MKKFITIIEPYIIPSMRYKIDMKYDASNFIPGKLAQPTELGNFLIDTREKLGWGQKKMAQYLGVQHWATISLWENGKRKPGKKSILKIEALKTRMHDNPNWVEDMVWSTKKFVEIEDKKLL